LIHREEARLRSLFQRLLILSAAASPAACSTSGASSDDASTPLDAHPSTDGAGGSTTDAGGGNVDATLGSDAAGSEDASDAGSAIDARDIYGFLDAACDPQYIDPSLVDGGGDGSCDFFENLPCGLPPGTETEVCALLVTQCGTLCSHMPTENRLCGVYQCLAVDASSIPNVTPLTLECATGAPACAPGIGRRPYGLVARRGAARGDAVGRTLAEMAYLEAASVHAFRRLASELASMRAPRALVRQAERSARDEVRHARVTARLARRRGAKPARVVIRKGTEARTLVDFAVENGVEGCVRECFGALVATRQASRATDPEVAREMGRIARDETRHAALAWEIARWLAPRLSPGDRARVKAAMESAVVALRHESSRTPADVAASLGLPTGAEARRLVDAFGAAMRLS
jgi:hypothetical protein